MNSARPLVLASAALILVVDLAAGQDLTRYRGYILGSSLDSVIAMSGARPTDTKTVIERPAKIQELQWRARYVRSSGELVDPVQEIAFTFFNDALYQVVVRYDRDRTSGLTDSDIIDTLATTYGAPVIASTGAQGARGAAQADAVRIATWESADASLTLARGTYSSAFQLTLISKALSTRARNATREAIRLDAAEAPRREADQRRKEAAEASATRDKARATNKPAFRP